MTLREALRWADHRLRGVTAVSYHEAEQLLISVCGVDRSHLYTHGDALVSAKDWSQISQLITRRQQGCPLAYLLGSQDFAGLELAVNRHTLIPRADSEVLLRVAWRVTESAMLDVADLGTGSGAIGLALAQHRPHWQVYLTDRSRQALDVAQKNAQRLGLTNVHMACGHWGDALPRRLWDVWISNPPYLAAGDPHLMNLSLQFEPKHALISGLDGLYAIRTLILQARRSLNAQGWLILEHGAEQAAQVRHSMQQAGFVHVDTEQDDANLDRVTYGQWPVENKKESFRTE